MILPPGVGFAMVEERRATKGPHLCYVGEKHKQSCESRQEQATVNAGRTIQRNKWQKINWERKEQGACGGGEDTGLLIGGRCAKALSMTKTVLVPKYGYLRVFCCKSCQSEVDFIRVFAIWAYFAIQMDPAHYAYSALPHTHGVLPEKVILWYSKQHLFSPVLSTPLQTPSRMQRSWSIII